MEVEVVWPNAAVYSALALHSWEEAVSSLFSNTSSALPLALLPMPLCPSPHLPVQV